MKKLLIITTAQGNNIPVDLLAKGNVEILALGDFPEIKKRIRDFKPDIVLVQRIIYSVKHVCLLANQAIEQNRLLAKVLTFGDSGTIGEIKVNVGHRKFLLNNFLKEQNVIE